MKPTLIILLVVVFLLGCGHPDDQHPPVLGRDAYSVYSNIVDSGFDAHVLIVIYDSTNISEQPHISDTGVVATLLQSNFGSTDAKAILQDFNGANRVRQHISKDSMHTRHVCLSPPTDSLRSVLRPGSWQELYFRGIQGTSGFVLIEFSAVGFNAERTKALVHFGWHAHPMIGTGQFLLMEKKEGKWAIVALKESWVS